MRATAAKKKIRLCFEATEEPDLASQADVRFISPLRKPAQRGAVADHARFSTSQSSAKQSRQRMYRPAGIFHRRRSIRRWTPLLPGMPTGPNPAMGPSVLSTPQLNVLMKIRPAGAITRLPCDPENSGEQHMIISAASDHRAAAQRILPLLVSLY